MAENDPTAIQIPADLLPADGRFGAGPSKVRPEQVAALAAAAPTYLGTSHRQKTVKSQVGRVRAGLAELFSLPEGYEVVLGNGGSTAFWDVATAGLIRDRAQFLTFGEFGSKFAKAAKDAPWLGEPTILKSEPGDAPEFAAEAGVDLYGSPHNETSTGVAITPRRVAGAPTRRPVKSFPVTSCLQASSRDFVRSSASSMNRHCAESWSGWAIWPRAWRMAPASRSTVPA